MPLQISRDTPFLLNHFIHEFLRLSSETGTKALKYGDLADVNFSSLYDFSSWLAENSIAFDIYNRIPGFPF